MADRYWVSGSGTWNASNTTNWSTTSGGAGGASVPTSADDVFFDANSGSGTVTVGATVNCADLNFTGYVGTFSGVFNINCYGSLNIDSDVTWNATSSLNFLATSGSHTITTNGKILGNVNINGTGGTWLLGDNLNTIIDPDFPSQGAVNFSAGTFDLNDFDIDCKNFYLSGTSVKVANLKSGTINCTQDPGAINLIRSVGVTNFTINPGTSKYITKSLVVVSGSVTLYDVEMDTSNSISVFNGNIECNSLSIKDTGENPTSTISFATNATINTLTLDTATLQSSVSGTPRTLTITNADIRRTTISDITSTTLIKAKNSTDAGGNTNINFVNVPANLPTTSVTQTNQTTTSATTANLPTTSVTPTNQTTTTSGIINLDTTTSNVTNL